MKTPYFSLNIRLLFSDLFRIRIRIRIRNPDPKPDPKCLFRFRIGSGSGQKFRILTDPVPDPQHWEKPWFLLFLLLFDFLSLNNDVNVPSKSNKQKNFFLNNFFVGLLKVSDEIVGSGSESGSISKRHGSADPDPDQHQNVIYPQHCYTVQ